MPAYKTEATSTITSLLALIAVGLTKAVTAFQLLIELLYKHYDRLNIKSEFLVLKLRNYYFKKPAFWLFFCKN